MGRLREEVTIAVPPSRVWRLIELHIAHPEESDDLGSPEGIKAGRGMVLSAQRSGVGTRTRWFYTYRKRPFVWDDIVTSWEPGKRVEWQTTSAWQMRDSFTLIPEIDETRLVYRLEYRLPYGLLGSLYGRLFLEPMMRRHLKDVLGRMKKLAENPLG